MMGSDGLENRGIIPRFYTDLLKRLKIMKEEGTIEAANCEVSYFEVYNERIYDLLQKQEMRKEPTKENFHKIISYENIDKKITLMLSDEIQESYLVRLIL